MTRILRLILRAACLWLLLYLAGPVAAQQDSGIDYDAWGLLASQVEDAVDASALSDAEFEQLRQEVADWRAQFFSERSANSDQINRIEAQIDALGPSPEDGASEPDAVANLRAQLNEELAEALLPRLAATEAFNRADGLISEIDTIIRDRSTDVLFEAEPTPLNPLNWTRAVTSALAVATEIAREVRVRTIFDLRREEIRDSLPGALALAVLGLVLLLRGRLWSKRATDALTRNLRYNGREAVAFIFSFTQFLIPLTGLLLMGAALDALGILGPLGTALLADLLALFALVFLAFWLGGRLVPDRDDVPMTVYIDRARWPAFRRLLVLIAVTVGAARLTHTFYAFDEVDPAARGVFILPVYIVLGLLFFRLSRVLKNSRDLLLAADEGNTGVLGRILQFVVPALRLVAFVGPLLAAAGYLNAAEALMVPTALSLGLLGVLQTLQVPIRDSYAALTRTPAEDAGQALVPVLVNFALAFLSIPVLALIWGVRPAQLVEVFAVINEGFALGDARVTPGTILSIVLVFGAGLLATRILQTALKSTVLPRTSLDTGARTAVVSGLGYVGFAIAALLAINAGGIDLTALGFVIGALSVGIGFGLQNVVSNFVAGIILLIERPISEGDWIEVNGQMGIVKDISVRSTRIETFDKTDVIVPNADFISGTVTNWTRGNNIGRAVLNVGVAYGTDTRRVQTILEEIAKAHPGVAAYPAPGVDFLGFGADSLDFRIRAILRDVNEVLGISTELNHQIAERFAAEGIEIPFAQRDIWLRNPEALRPAVTSSPVQPIKPQPTGPASPDLAEPDGD
ncbi:MAG: DUF3772 domain-containing protein [Pseudomonadota bacterium]